MLPQCCSTLRSRVEGAVQAPLFTDKARLYPRSTFVVGWDTAERLVMPKYYDGEAGMLSQFAELRVRGCRCAVSFALDFSQHVCADLEVMQV